MIKAALTALVFCVSAMSAPPKTGSQPADSAGATTLVRPAVDTVDHDPMELIRRTDDTTQAPAADSSADTGKNAIHAVDSTFRAAEDTTYRFWSRPYFIMGASWTLGSSPLFSAWEQGMPDSLGSFGLNSEMFPHDTAGGKADYRRLEFEVKEKPNTYNVSFPVRIALVPRTTPDYSFALCLEGDFLMKTFQASIQHDTGGHRINMKREMIQAVLDVGVWYERVIPIRYFTIADIDRASILVGLFLEPVEYLRRSGSATSVLPPDSLYSHILDQVRSEITDAGSAYGFGLSWRFGITALKRYSQTSGIVAGLGYRGNWQYFPTVTENDLNRYLGGNKRFSGVSHRLSLDVQFAVGRKNNEIKTAPGPGGH